MEGEDEDVLRGVRRGEREGDDVRPDPPQEPPPLAITGGAHLLMLAAAAHQQLMKNRKGRR